MDEKNMKEENSPSYVEWRIDNVKKSCRKDEITIEGVKRIIDINYAVIKDSDSTTGYIDFAGKTAELLCDMLASYAHVRQAKYTIDCLKNDNFPFSDPKGQFVRSLKNSIQSLREVSSKFEETADTIETMMVGLEDNK